MRRGTMVTAAGLLTALFPGAGAHAIDVPAYGVITISNDGLGVTAQWTYDPAFWFCYTQITGPFHAPTLVTVTCLPAQGGSFVCPLMVLTTQTSGLAARAGGRARCTTTVETPIISGINSAQRTGNLGRVVSLECSAYGGEYPLVPPYTVSCTQPGLPENV